jgi:outer membrane protein assembly factor BamD (BamD/ComL family)
MVDMEVEHTSRAILIRLVIAAGVSVALSGCMTLRDVKDNWSEITLRKRSQPWDKSKDDEFDVMGERRGSRLVARDFQPRNFMTTMRVMTAVKDDQDAAQKKLQEGRELFQQASQMHETNDRAAATPLFQQAANCFREAAARWPNSSLEEDALFMQGEAFFFADEYVLANRAYESLITEFSGTSYLDQAEARRFAIAQYWLKVADAKPAANWINVGSKMLPAMNLAGEARRILHRIRLDDPTGKLADDATMALGSAFFRAGQYQEAADAFDDLRKSYPASPHQFNAHLFELKSVLQTYAGPEYDSEPLAKADQLLKAMVKLFPTEVEQQKEYLASEGARVRNMLAEREYQLGKYYEARGENRAAEVYYAAVADAYKDTSLSQTASERAAEVAKKEPEPVQKVAWFVDLFPEPKSTRPLIPSGSQEKIYR